MEIEIPAGELEEVIARVVPAACADETRIDGDVRLDVVDGRRVWIATDSIWMVMLRAGAGADVAVSMPPRLLRGTWHSSTLRLTIPAVDEDGRPRGHITLADAHSRAETHLPTSRYPDWRAIVAVAEEAPTTSVRVDPRVLYEALAQVSVAPFDLSEHGAPPPPVELAVGAGELSLRTDWPIVGPTVVTVPAVVEGPATEVLASAGRLQDLLVWAAGERVTLHVPRVPSVSIRVEADDWSALLMPISRDWRLAPTRERLEALLKEEYDLDELIADEDGDYPFRVGDGVMFVQLVDREDRPPLVRVFARLVEQAERSLELLEELNDLNARIGLARMFWFDGRVVAETEVIATDLDGSELRAAIGAVQTVVTELAPILSVRFGEVVPPPAETDLTG